MSVGSVLAILFLVIEFLALCGVGIYYLIIYFKEKPLKIDGPILINFGSNKCNKRFVGIETEVKSASNGRIIIKYSPRDTKELVEIDEEYICPNSHRVVIPKGGLSKEKDISFAFPVRIEDFDENFKNTDIGKAFMWLSELKNIENTTVTLLRKGHLDKDALLSEIGTGELSKQYLAFTNECVKDVISNAIKKDERKDVGLPVRQ